MDQLAELVHLFSIFDCLLDGNHWNRRPLLVWYQKDSVKRNFVRYNQRLTFFESIELYYFSYTRKIDDRARFAIFRVYEKLTAM